MLVVDGTVELLSIEPNLSDNCQTDPYEKSKPEVFLEEIKDFFGLNFVTNDSEESDFPFLRKIHESLVQNLFNDY